MLDRRASTVPIDRDLGWTRSSASRDFGINDLYPPFSPRSRGGSSRRVARRDVRRRTILDIIALVRDGNFCAIASPFSSFPPSPLLPTGPFTLRKGHNFANFTCTTSYQRYTPGLRCSVTQRRRRIERGERGGRERIVSAIFIHPFRLLPLYYPIRRRRSARGN